MLNLLSTFLLQVQKLIALDNAVAESLFKTLKSDLVYGNKFQTLKEAKTAVFEYIEIWYNRKRLHSSLGYRTPQEMETHLLNIKLVA